MTKSDALKLEYRVKHVPADSKYDELITNQIDLNLIDREKGRTVNILAL